MRIIIFTALLLSVLLNTFLFAQADKDYEKIGDEYYGKFDNYNALIYYEKGYAADPGSYTCLLKLTRAYNDMGEELLDQRKHDQAEQYIVKALSYAELFQQRYPDSADVYTYLAMSYGNMAMFKGGKQKVTYALKVKDNAEKAIRLKPGNFLPYIILGIYYREAAGLSWYQKLFAKAFLGGVPEGTYKQSIQMFEKALSIDPNMIVADYQLSKTYRRMGETEKEKALLKKVMELPLRNFRDKYAKLRSEKLLAEASN